MQSKHFIAEFFRSFSHLFDILFSLLIVGPLVVIYWVTTWKICDIFIKPEEPQLSATISFVIGFSGQFALVFYQDLITKSLKFKKCKFLNLIVSKLYALFAALTCISFWRGVWKFIDIFSPSDQISIALNVAQNLLILILSKTLKNSLAPPFVLSLDSSAGNYSAGTFFKKKVKEILKTVEIISLIFLNHLRKLMEVLRSLLTAFVR